MRKAAVDIPALIAEASAKADDADAARAIAASVAFGSKLEYYALIAFDLTFIDEPAYLPYANEIIEIKKMLQGFRRSLRQAGE